MILTYLEAAAVIVSALSGMMTAAGKKMDLVGVYIMALLVSFGGGTLRDVLLDHRPFFWVSHYEYLIVVLMMCIAFSYFPPFFRLAELLLKRSNTIDAIGLGMFSIVGTLTAVQLKQPMIVCSLMGVITGIAGGVFRDLVINQIPQVFRPDKGLHAVASFIGCWTFLLLLVLIGSPFISYLISVIIIVVVRMSSLRWNFGLPRSHWSEEERH